MTPQHFVEILTSLTFVDTFNPYAHRCLTHDNDDAPLLRRKVLLDILEVAVKSKVDAIWIGRDLGYRGGRRTGLALTDDVHMQEHARRWGIPISIPTRGEAVAERTAAVIWNILSQINANIFLWNVFPLHPHVAGKPFSNRLHNVSERRAGEEILLALIKLLNPTRLIAIGNDAAVSTRRLFKQTNVIQVRHPSYGGQTEFLNDMCDLYSLQQFKINAAKK